MNIAAIQRVQFVVHEILFTTLNVLFLHQYLPQYILNCSSCPYY